MIFLELIILFDLHLVSSQFTYAPPLVICNYLTATLGAPISNYCKGVSSGTTLNLHSMGALSSKTGYLSFLPTASNASAYLKFGGGSCFDARGMSEFVIQMQVSTPISLKITFGTSEACLNRDSADTSTTINVAGTTAYQSIRLPVSFFANMNLQKLYMIGIQSVSPLNVEIKILKIYFSRKQFVTRTRHELFEWTSTGVRVPYRFSSFNAPNMIGRTGKGPDGLLDPYEQEDLFISAMQLGGRVIRTYTLRVRTPSDISTGVGTSKAIQGIGSWGEAQLLAIDRTLMFANKHMIRVILPFIDNWEFFGGVESFAAFRGKTRDSFFNDPTLISDFKNVISMLLNRKNTLTGIIYKNDPAILAWQLGNELCVGELQDWTKSNWRLTPPISWAETMVSHIKTIDQNHLIMDGYWGNKANHGGEWDSNLISIRYIDILNVHYYGGESDSSIETVYSSRMNGNAVNAVNARKAVIIDEFGIARRAVLRAVQQVIMTVGNNISGVLIWSIRSGSVNGGALVHNEYAGYQSYQWPGYTKGPRCNAWFREDNYDVVTDMRNTAATILLQNGLSRPSIYPPCSHNGAILEAVVQAPNNQSVSCIWTYKHTIPGASSSYRAVNLRIRQPNGAYSNMVQFSFDNIKFVNLDYVNMTVTEGQFLYAHYVPIVTSGGTTRNISYRISGLLINNQNTSPSQYSMVSVSDVDTVFYNWWISQSSAILNNSNARIC